MSTVLEVGTLIVPTIIQGAFVSSFHKHIEVNSQGGNISAPSGVMYLLIISVSSLHFLK